MLVNIESDKIPKAKELLLTALKRYPRSGNLYLARGIIHKRNFENDAAEIDKKLRLTMVLTHIWLSNIFQN